MERSDAPPKTREERAAERKAEREKQLREAKEKDDAELRVYSSGTYPETVKWSIRQFPEKAANEMRQLQEKWKPVAAAPRSQATALWTRFKTAQDAVYEKCKDFFAQQNAERAENLKKKTALAERAEALQDSTDWVKTADAIKQLQAEWKEIGPVTRGHERASWERFRDDILMPKLGAGIEGSFTTPPNEIAFEPQTALGAVPA